MYFIDLLFVLYKYNTYFLKQQESYSNNKKNKLKNLFKDIILITRESIHKSNKLNTEELESHIYNFGFPENKEYINYLIEKTNIYSKKTFSILFADIITSFGDIYDINMDFNKKNFIESYINQIQEININKDNIQTKNDKNICEDETDPFQVLNFKEFQKNLQDLGLPTFDFL